MSAASKTGVVQKPTTVRVKGSRKQQERFAKTLAYILLTVAVDIEPDKVTQ